MASHTVESLVALFGLSPHPEGGYFHELFRATQRVQRAGSGATATATAALVARADRAASTAIYFLLPAATFSAWHVVGSDEVWHYYDGSPLELHTIDPAGAYRKVVLGRDFAAGERPVHVVPAGWLQAARSVAPPVPTPAPPVADAAPGYTLCGCTVSPGFEFAEFEQPARGELHRRYPALGPIVDALTRP
ncbi:MAG TPA: cupin domain-containing protein [Kofleriaceae bacterium]|jgi:hypothetical protein|nr:cupin domain-containing protein [Kofleriaceae bacterium]